MGSFIKILCRIPPIYWLLLVFLSKPYVIKGLSMYPTLITGDHVLFNRLSYAANKPGRGDIVIIDKIIGKKRSLVKRIIGLPTETIKIDSGIIYINGRELVEKNVTLTFDDAVCSEEWHLGQKEYFVLGDTRSISEDSRMFGPIAGEDIKSRAWSIYWPISRAQKIKTTVMDLN